MPKKHISRKTMSFDLKYKVKDKSIKEFKNSVTNVKNNGRKQVALAVVIVKKICKKGLHFR